jgi:hypothetical protein
MNAKVGGGYHMHFYFEWDSRFRRTFGYFSMKEALVKHFGSPRHIRAGAGYAA